MKDSMFWIAVAEHDRRRARARRDRRDQRAGRRPAPDHPVLDVLRGAVAVMALVAVLVHR